MPSTVLTIVSTMVGFEGWREQPGNKARLLLAEQVMIWAREKARAHLIVFPAGFLCATDVAEARALAGRAVALAKQRSLIASHTYQCSRIWNATQHFSSVVGLPTLLAVHQVGSQYGQMRLPSSADYVDAQTGEPKQHSKMIMAGSRSS